LVIGIVGGGLISGTASAMKLVTRQGINARSGDVAFIVWRVRIALLTTSDGGAIGGWSAGDQEEEAEEGEDDTEDGLHFVFIASGYKVGWIGL